MLGIDTEIEYKEGLRYKPLVIIVDYPFCFSQIKCGVIALLIEGRFSFSPARLPN
jgi:hypothetical protein